jgi:hypothetical protein
MSYRLWMMVAVAFLAVGVTGLAVGAGDYPLAIATAWLSGLAMAYSFLVWRWERP